MMYIEACSQAKRRGCKMKILDNVNAIVRDDLQQTIHKGSKLSIAAAFFSIYAYGQMRQSSRM